MDRLMVIGAAFLLDILLGDPQGFPHPVRCIGWLIEKGEAFFRPLFPHTKKGELLAGGALTLGVLISTGGIVFLLIQTAGRVGLWAEWGIQILLCYYLLAMKSLKTESMKVYQALEKGDLNGARTALSWIVGRDTANLSEEGITKAAVETVAENCSDGVVAPLFYMMLGGPLWGYLYKAVNTMDSMIGYQNEKYLYFGRVAARLDDLLNYIPARLSGYSMVAAAFLLRYDGKNACRIYKRDRRNHKSPNSAQTEAACAGALGLCLGGDSFYFGKKVEKPCIGDKIRQAVPMDIVKANRLHYGTCAVSALVLGAFWTAWRLLV